MEQNMAEKISINTDIFQKEYIDSSGPVSTVNMIESSLLPSSAVTGSIEQQEILETPSLSRGISSSVSAETNIKEVEEKKGGLLGPKSLIFLEKKILGLVAKDGDDLAQLKSEIDEIIARSSSQGTKLTKNRTDSRLRKSTATVLTSKSTPSDKDTLNDFSTTVLKSDVAKTMKSAKRKMIEEETAAVEEEKRYRNFFAVKNTKLFFEKLESGKKVKEYEPTSSIFYLHEQLQLLLKKALEKKKAKVPQTGITESDARREERCAWRAEATFSRPIFPHRLLISDWNRNIKRQEGMLMGPGTYDYDSNLTKQRCQIKSKGVFGSCSPRFPVKKKPPPMPLGQTDAWAKWDKACEKKKHRGCFVPFESTPCNFRNVDQRSTLGPGIYNMKSFVDVLKERNAKLKAKSTVCDSEFRGTIKYGYFKDIYENPELGPGTYDAMESIRKRLFNRSNQLKGRFMRAEARNQKFSENSLGPGSYNIEPETRCGAKGRRSKPIKKPIFIENQSADVKLQVSRVCGPGYYRVGLYKYKIKGGGFTSNFKSGNDGRPPPVYVSSFNAHLHPSSASSFAPSEKGPADLALILPSCV